MEKESIKMDLDSIYSSKSEGGGAVDFTSLLGTWVNSNEKTKWIKSFILTQQDNKIAIQAYGSQTPEDWGEKEIITFVNETGERAFWTRYNLGEFELLLAANTNQGLWVVAAHLKFKDSTKPNFLCREFYYRADE
jgi:hypothetical protein